ncbi:MAG: 50S ribosomal protein L11 methyltransferase [Chloroflexota bacterium]
MTRSAEVRGSGTPAPQSGSWLELAVEADLEAVEAVSEILGRLAPGGTSVEPGFDLVDEGLGARIDPARPAVVRAYIEADDPAAVRRAIRATEEALSHLQAFGLRPIGELRTRTVAETDWAGAWKAHFPVMRIGKRLVIKPTWRRHRSLPGDLIIALDPGMAFGTGLHPTTRLCLGAVERSAERGELAGARVVDVGCGSGILAIAAARLGAADILGVDTDPIASEATDANARRNRLARVIRSRVGSLPSGEPPHDLVLANLIASVLIALAVELHAELRPGGVVLASGIFMDREADVAAAFRAAGLEIFERTTEGDWVVLAARRPD